MAQPLEDPERRDFDPYVDRVWRAYVTLDLDMFVTAKDEAEAERVAEDHWHEHLESYDVPIISVRELTGAPSPALGMGGEIPWGRTLQVKGRELTVEQLMVEVEWAKAHPVVVYDEQTLLMPWVDSPPPYRKEES